MSSYRIAVPSDGEGGLDGIRSGHFGHCDTFTLVDVENGAIKQVSTIANQAHVEGGCMVPVNLLAQHNVNALIASGMGMRPFLGFKQVGIEVYFDGQQPSIRIVVQALIDGQLQKMGDDMTCGGGGGHGGGHGHPHQPVE